MTTPIDQRMQWAAEVRRSYTASTLSERVAAAAAADRIADTIEDDAFWESFIDTVERIRSEAERGRGEAWLP
jgi:hypothetical protein